MTLKKELQTLASEATKEDKKLAEEDCTKTVAGVVLFLTRIVRAKASKGEVYVSVSFDMLHDYIAKNTFETIEYDQDMYERLCYAIRRSSLAKLDMSLGSHSYRDPMSFGWRQV